MIEITTHNPSNFGGITNVQSLQECDTAFGLLFFCLKEILMASVRGYTPKNPRFTGQGTNCGILTVSEYVYSNYAV